MKALVFEPFSGGHCTMYVSMILPALIRLLDDGLLERVTLTTTAEHRESSEFADLLACFEPRVHFDVVPRRLPLRGQDVADMLRDAIVRNAPDYVISTYADRGALPLALQTLVHPALRRPDVLSIGIVHHGFHGRARGIRALVRDGVHRFARRFAPWSEIHMVNPLLYDAVHGRSAWTERHVKLLPHPVARQPFISKTDARRRLGLPGDGVYVGQIGKSDGRKAIPELLAAFRAADLPADRRVLLAGTLFEPYRELIDREYADLVRSGRLIVIDRYLDNAEYHVAVSAMDVISIAYHTDDLASNLLAALAAGRPVIADRRGYTGMVVERFGAGSVTDIHDPAAFSATLRSVLEENAAFTLTHGAERLVRYHDPENFSNTLLQPLYARMGLALPRMQTWEQACRPDGSRVT